jgi:outer membrane lipoprotein-sorting protein
MMQFRRRPAALLRGAVGLALALAALGAAAGGVQQLRDFVAGARSAEGEFEQVATPAAILFGSGALDDNFELADAGEQDGLAWAEARPRQTESGFESLRIGLADGQLRRMEMRDHFGQTTVIRFTRLRANPALAEDRFRFEPPAGADVIGELPGAR